MSNTQARTDFYAITGADGATADRFLATANWNLELAISNYFDNVPTIDYPSHGVAIPNLPDPEDPPHELPIPISRCRPHPMPHPVPPIPPYLPPIIPPLDDADFPVVTQLSAGSVILPLHGLSVALTVNQYMAQVQVLHRFINMESNPIEAVFTFQQEDVSIYEFYAEVGGKKIISECKEKQAALDKYDDALAAGDGGYLLDKASEDQFKLNVGNLPPYAECIISIKYATLVNTQGDALKVTVPITKVAVMLRGGEVVNWDTKNVSEIPNGLTVNATLQMASPIFGIESNTHEIKYEITGHTAVVSLAGLPTEQPAREFTFMVGLQDPHVSGSSVVEVQQPSKNSPGTSTAMMLSFYPKIEAQVDEDVLMEYVFLVDRSGSMSGSRMSQLINALQLLLRSIPVGSLFNIVGFGSTYERLFPSSVVYDDNSFATATNHAAGMKANLISTNILPPLYDILSKPTHSKFPRQLFILTDGEVENTEQVISMVKKNIGATRIFTIGIGAEASKRLVKGLARAGKGQADFVNSGVRMEPAVLAQLKRAMQPHLSVDIDWGTLANDIKQAPAVIPPAFPGNAVVVFGLLNRELRPEDNNVMMKLSSPGGDTQYIPLALANASSGSLVGVLATTAVISDVEKKLEEKQLTDSAAKNVIVPLALRYSLVTKYTSLVAQEVRDTLAEGTMVLREMGELIPPQVQMLKAVEEKRNHMVGFAPPPAPAPAPMVPGGGFGGGYGGGGHGRGGFGGGYGGGAWRADEDRYDGGGARRGGSYAQKDREVSKAKKLFSTSPARSGRQESEKSFQKKSGSTHKPIPQNKNQKSELGNGGMGAAGGYYSEDRVSMRRSRSSSYSEDEEADDSAWEVNGYSNYESAASHASYAAPPAPPASMAAPIQYQNQNYPQQYQQQLQQQQFGHFSHGPSADLLSSPFSSVSASSTTSAPARPDPNKRPLDLFVVMQQASGNWTLSPAFLTTIGKTKSQLEAVFGSLDGWLGNVVATALAIVFMETRFAENIDEWSMLKDKATRWMTKEINNKKHSETMDQVIQKARTAL